MVHNLSNKGNADTVVFPASTNALLTVESTSELREIGVRIDGTEKYGLVLGDKVHKSESIARGFRDSHT